jgi:hypothetical protein
MWANLASSGCLLWKGAWSHSILRHCTALVLGMALGAFLAIDATAFILAESNFIWVGQDRL